MRYGLAVLCAASLSAACTACFVRNQCFSEGEYAQFRQVELPVYARGFSYLATTEIVAECTTQLDVSDVYEELDPAFAPFWATIFVEKLVDVTWKSNGAPDPEGMLFAAVLPNEGQHLDDFALAPGPYDTNDPFQPRLFVNAFPYRGPADGILDAGFVCGDVPLNPETTLIVRRFFGETEREMEVSLGLPIEQLMEDLDEVSVEITVLSQEALVSPRAAVVEVVGDFEEIPALPERPGSTICDGSD